MSIRSVCVHSVAHQISIISEAVSVTQETKIWLGPRPEVDATEIRKFRLTSKAEPLFISTSYHNTIIMESELTVSEKKRVCPNVKKLFGVMSFNMPNILDYHSISAVIFKLYIYIYIYIYNLFVLSSKNTLVYIPINTGLYGGRQSLFHTYAIIFTFVLLNYL
jgi:hypothetical protein